MICCKCKRPIDRSYGRVTDLGNYCYQCATQNEIEAERTIVDQMKQIQEKARKETAKELLTVQFKEYKECEKRVLEARNNNKNDDYYKGFSLATTNQKMYLKELAKQFGVEIKE